MDPRFTDEARSVFSLANQEAIRLGHEYIGTEHILLGLTLQIGSANENRAIAATVLHNLNLDPNRIRADVESLVLPGQEMLALGKMPQTPRAKKVIEYAMNEARHLRHDVVGVEHILLGLLREHEGVAGQVLSNLGLTVETAREEIIRVVNPIGDSPDSDPPQPTACWVKCRV